MVMGSLFKDMTREIINTRGRFLGILAIVALGVAFYTGLGATGHDMKLTGDAYFNAQDLMDIRVVSTYGLNGNDIKAIADVPGVRYLYPSQNMDVQIVMNGQSGNVKVHAYEPDAEINRPVLVRGAWPQAAAECLVEAELLLRFGLEIGDRVTLGSGKSFDIRSQLRNRTYVIAGVVITPYYISMERGASSIGRGEADFFMCVPQANFISDVYAEAFIRVEGADRLSCFGDEYEDRIDKVTDAIEAAGERRAAERAGEMTANAYTRLQASEKELEASRAQTLQSMDEAAASLAEAAGDVSAGLPGMANAVNDLLNQEQTLDDSLAEIASAVKALEDAEYLLDGQEAALRSSRRDIMDAELYLGAEFSARMLDIDNGLNAVAAARESLAENRRALNENVNSLTESRAVLWEAYNTAHAGEVSVVMGRRAIAAQETELAAERVTALAQLDEALAEVQAARETLDDLETPEWFVLNRDANPGYASYADDTDKIMAIGQVFPLIFFVVAALVCLTSMTRLVEERRMEIGTLKSLGYGSGWIVMKYMVYAVLPTLIGGAAGGYIGMSLFPRLIIQAYNMMYSTPSPATPMNMDLWMRGIGMGLASTGLATAFACANELRESPSVLLRPKAPKAGKRNFIEILPFLWRRFNFIQKVTIRNLLRYKKRLLMTVIGISGCTALLVTGYGIKDSISGIIEVQFGALNHYNMMVSFTDSVKSNEVTRAQDIVAQSDLYRNSLMARQKTMDALAEEGTTYQATVIVPETTEGLDHFFTFRDRATHEEYTLSNSGAVITEKLSRLLDVRPGGTILLQDGDNAFVEIPVAAVTETYFMHYVYITESMYQDYFGEAPEYNTLFSVVQDGDTAATDELAQELLDERGVNGVSFIRGTVENFSDMIGSLDFVMYVLIVSAGALALVVLLNLTNININERIRELATIEVLGFYDNEVAAYIYRENAVLTAMGAALGLLLGVSLHLYVILTVETDIMMFGRDIKPVSFIYSVALTVFFALVVNLITANKLKKINMVEALKSAE